MGIQALCTKRPFSAPYGTFNGFSSRFTLGRADTLT